jgi:hypothetical protein
VTLSARLGDVSSCVGYHLEHGVRGFGRASAAPGGAHFSAQCNGHGGAGFAVPRVTPRRGERHRARSVSMCELIAEVGNYTTLVNGSHEYFVVFVASYFRHLASAPKVRWRARAGAPALGQEPR